METVSWDIAGIQTKLNTIKKPCYIVRQNGHIGVTHEGTIQETDSHQAIEILTAVSPIYTHQLGDSQFCSAHGIKYAYMAGAMANGIASEELVIALGKAGILGSFGAGGLGLDRIEAAIHRIQQALPSGPYAFNLIHSPSEAAIERRSVELYIKRGIKTIEASAFLGLTSSVVHYRVSGLQLSSAGHIEINHKIIAKVSRAEVATKFMSPAPTKILQQLLEQGLISEQQAKLAETVPMADDITVEGDSGGHTDNRPIVALLPTILQLRHEIQEKYRYQTPIRVGAAGGIGTPHSVLAAFMMGAAYVVTGSVNQACVEAGTSAQVKQLLAQASITDMAMAPAADMFEMGVKLQVLKRGSFFPMRAQKLFDYYQKYQAIEEIPSKERQQLEQQIFRKDLDTVWQETVAYFQQRDPDQIARSIDHPKRKMALIFRSYLGQASRWAITGDEFREADYQIWCGPTMGAFNAWVEGTYLAQPENRRVVDVATHLMQGAAILYRLQTLKLQGLELAPHYFQYLPEPF
uniref:PfaD family polyunsaturated fatty acid/polyketide biosynthesis protein n=1 Tax=Oculatella sp. LEGE 06141 TaxID=1828648 RepID=UPI0030D96E4F